jgi:hypothetical protein
VHTAHTVSEAGPQAVWAYCPAGHVLQGRHTLSCAYAQAWNTNAPDGQALQLAHATSRLVEQAI